MSFHPKFVPHDRAFELLVHLTLELEHPGSVVIRNMPPDWGIDVTRKDGIVIHAYQCKHHPSPSKATLLRELNVSLASALKKRDILNWKTFTLCVSGDLTAQQRHECTEVALDMTLKKREFDIRAGTQFVATLAQNPWIWQEVTSSACRKSENLRPMVGIPCWVDSRFRRIVAKLAKDGESGDLPGVLFDQALTDMAIDDFYEIAACYYDSTENILRMTSFDIEIPTFWLVRQGARYFALNKRLLARGVAVKRLYVVDLGTSVLTTEVLRTFLSYIAEQEKAGILCRVVDYSAFSETVRLACSLFGIQDRNNVVMFSRDGHRATLSRDISLVDSAIDTFEDLLHGSEAKKPVNLLEIIRC